MNKKIFGSILFACMTSLNAFAGGTVIGSGGKSMESFSAKTTLGDFTERGTLKDSSQVYYMGKKQAEIEFATNKAGDDKVEIQSLRPEEISDSALIDGLKRSQQSKQWENIKLPSKIDMNRIILNNKLGGMQVR